MKSYKTPEAEIVNIQLSEYCDLVNTSSWEIGNPSEGGTGGATTPGIGEVSGKDDF